MKWLPIQGVQEQITFIFHHTELNESSIRQLAWEKNLILTIQSVDSFVNKVNYSDILN
jgi:hypothetical protein